MAKVRLVLVAGALGSAMPQLVELGHKCVEVKHERYAHTCDVCLAHTGKRCEKCVAKGFDCHCSCGWQDRLLSEKVDDIGKPGAVAASHYHHPAASRALPKYALCLFGSVAKWHKSGEAIISGQGKSSDYINIRAVYTAYNRHLFKPLLLGNMPRHSVIDVFIHSWVPSPAVQAQLLAMYIPVQYAFENNAAWAKTEVRKRAQNQLQERSMWTSVARSLSLLLAHSAGPREGQEYEWIVLSRPDVLHWRDFSLSTFMSTVTYTAAPRAKNAEMACHTGRPCDIEFGSDIHLTLTHKGAAWLARIPEAFASLDLTPHSGFIRTLMGRGGLPLKHDSFRLAESVLT